MDDLFLLSPDFADPAAGPGLYYCPHCAIITGVLAYYPHLRDTLRIHEVSFLRPRPAVAALLGPQYPGCPLLVLDESHADRDGFRVKTAPTGRRYIEETKEIQRYLALVHGAGAPHP